MKFLLVSLMSVLVVSCADFESESFGPQTEVNPFEKMSNDVFGHENADKNLYLDITTNKKLVTVQNYKKEPGETEKILNTWIFNCNTGCVTEPLKNKTYKKIKTNNNRNEITIDTFNTVDNALKGTQKYMLLR